MEHENKEMFQTLFQFSKGAIKAKEIVHLNRGPP